MEPLVFSMLLWIPIMAWRAYFFRRNFRLYIAADASADRQWHLGKKDADRTRGTRHSRSLFEQSIYQRSKALATLQVSTAGGTITIPYIPLELAQQLQRLYIV